MIMFLAKKLYNDYAHTYQLLVVMARVSDRLKEKVQQLMNL